MAPVVVQGTSVGNPGGYKNDVQVSQIESRKETGCNDIIFAILFYINVIAIVGVAAAYGPSALEDQNSPTSYTNVSYSAYISLTAIVAVVSLIFSAGGMAILMCIPQFMIKVALIFTVIMSFVGMVMAFMSGNVLLGIISLIFFGITLCYAWAVWSRIPFAAINLVTASTAVKANLGIVIYAFVFTCAGAVWSVIWSVAFIGLYDQTYTCDANNVCTDPNYGYLFLLFVAFFFGQQVFQYSIHVITAGTVATWWFEPSACGCCSSAINGSFFRTLTTSFGSICFGSLLVAILQALRMLANAAQQEGDMQFLACIAECILSCLASIVEFFNKWAFVYVGIYGMPYIKSAKSVMELFGSRGWEAIIADQLVGDTLLLVSLVVGIIVGGVATLVQSTSGMLSEGTPTDIDNAFAFTLGFVVGLGVCSILMSTIGSAVNAVIVLFAEAPTEFQQNYPDLSQRMRQIWSQIYPGSV